MTLPRRLLLAGCLFALAACASGPAGREDLLAFLVDGSTSRGEVRLRLGEPSRRYEDSRLESYRVGRGSSGWFVPAGPSGWDVASHSLVLQFDPGGVLQRHALVAVRP